MDKKIVIVSGGSKGLGLSICHCLLDAGFFVRTFSRSPSDDTRSLGQLYANTGHYSWKALDATDHEGLAAFVRGIHSEEGHIAGLINNAGVNLDRLLPMTGPDEIHKVISVNLESLLLLTRLVTRVMIQGGSGSIINVSSVIGYRGIKGTSVYAATKSAVLGFTRSLARELGPRDIRVNAILPGYIDTEMTAGMESVKMEQVIRRTPLGRLGYASDIAGVTEFLLSPASGFITGQAIVVDGGLTC